MNNDLGFKAVGATLTLVMTVGLLLGVVYLFIKFAPVSLAIVLILVFGGTRSVVSRLSH